MRAANQDSRLIAGRYRLLDPIGRGAMGVVWRGRDELLHRDVAVKEVMITAGQAPGDSRLTIGEASYQRTLREARAAARLSHPGVITVFDIVDEDASPWIVMELIRGRSLDQVIAEDGPLPPRDAAQLGASLLSALAAAHAAGVLHRDVKPANVLVAADGRIVLTDFGIAKIGADSGLTRSGMVVGTPGYTPPERVRGEPATPASDLWSLGATLYAAVEGRGPFDRPGGVAAICAGIVGEEPPRAPSAGSLAPVIAALLRRDSAARPDAAATAALLADAAGGDLTAGPPGAPAPYAARAVAGSSGYPAAYLGPAAAAPRDPAARGGTAAYRHAAGHGAAADHDAAAGHRSAAGHGDAPDHRDAAAYGDAAAYRAAVGRGDAAAYRDPGAYSGPAAGPAGSSRSGRAAAAGPPGSPADPSLAGTIAVPAPGPPGPAGFLDPPDFDQLVMPGRYGASDQPGGPYPPGGPRSPGGPYPPGGPHPPGGPGTHDPAWPAFLDPTTGALVTRNPASGSPASGSQPGASRAGGPLAGEVVAGEVVAGEVVAGGAAAGAALAGGVMSGEVLAEGAPGSTGLGGGAPWSAEPGRGGAGSALPGSALPGTALPGSTGPRGHGGRGAQPGSWPAQPRPVPPPPPRPRARPGYWRLAAVGAGIAAIVLAALAGVKLYDRTLTTAGPGSTAAPAGGEGGGQSAAGAPAARNTAAGTTAVNGAPPAGYAWHTVTAAALGTTAGFVIAAPEHWQVAVQGQAAYLEPPSGVGSIEVSAAPFAAAQPMTQAEREQAAAIAGRQYPGYRLYALVPTTFHGSASAAWRFSWRLGATRTSVLTILSALPTSAGTQPYTMRVSAPSPYFAAAREVFYTALRTFRPLPG